MSAKRKQFRTIRFLFEKDVDVDYVFETLNRLAKHFTIEVVHDSSNEKEPLFSVNVSEKDYELISLIPLISIQFIPDFSE